MSINYTEHIIEEEVKFYIENENYYAVTNSGLLLNIIKSVSIQPEIKNIDDYFTYLFFEAKEGFFIARQRIKNFKSDVWILEKEIIPDEKNEFYDIYLKEIKTLQK